MRYINPRFTYLLIYRMLIDHRGQQLVFFPLHCYVYGFCTVHCAVVVLIYLQFHNQMLSVIFLLRLLFFVCMITRIFI